MITLTINNSYSKISGLTPAQEKELKALLSYTVGSWARKHRPKKKSLLSRRGEFPSGLVTRVKKLFPKAIIDDLRIRPKIVGNAYFSFDPYEAQWDALNQAIVKGKGCISMPTGTGKSRVIGMIATSLGLKTLVVVPSLEIKKQLTQDLKMFPAHKNITIENIDSVRLKTLTKFDVLIIDEAHHVAAKTYQKLNKTAWTGIYHRFFLTATPFRNNKEETLLFEAIAGDLIYQLSYKEATAKRYIVPVEAFYIDIPKQETNARTWSQVYSELVVKNDARNLMISRLLLDLLAAGKSTLCLVKEVAHGQEISDITGIPFVNGKDDSSREYISQFSNGKITALIGTEAIVGEGIDTKSCEFVIIAGLGKAKSALMQKIGRAVRTYPGKESAKIILIRDTSHKFTRRHYAEQCKVIKEEYGVTVTKLEV